MKKNFLMLLLMSLLPLAGWAQVDLSDGWSIQLSAPNATYTGADLTPTVTLVKAGDPASPLTADKFNVSWDKSPIINVDGEGYTVTVTNDMTHTYGDLAQPTKKFWVLKETSAITTDPVLAADKDYDGNDYTLVTNLGAASFGEIEFIESADEPAANAAGWSTASPKAKSAGAHKVWYRVAGTDNYNGVAIKALGTVTINGLPIIVTTDPAAIGGLKYNTEAQALITAGAVTADQGTMMYKVGDDEWSTSVPTATNAGNYTVSWMVKGEEGYIDIAPANIAVTIAKGTPEFTAAPTGAEGLIYNKKNQKLLTAPATATLGATVTYKINGGAAKAYNSVTGKNAGDYTITAFVAETDNLNSVTATGEDVIQVTIAQKAAAAPTAIAGLKYNKLAQNLINAGEEGIVLYSTDGGANWVDVVDDIKGTNAGDYDVLYKVTDPNYVAVPATAMSNVKIAKAYMTIVVKNVTKTYDNTYNLPAFSPASYECIAQQDDWDLTGMGYKAVTNKNAGSYGGVVDVNVPVNAANNNYDITVIKGNLTINKAKLTVTANTGLTCNMDADAATLIQSAYAVSGLQGGDTKEQVFASAAKQPKLTSNAPTPLVPGTYDLSFTKGTLKTSAPGTNYEMSTAGDGGYVIPDEANLVVTPVAGTKVMITVVGHEKVYGQLDPDYTKWQAGSDYYVSGLREGDAIKSIAFSRAEGEDVGDYALSATATVNHPEWYDADIVYNNSKLTITPKELVATLTDQYFAVGASEDALDQDAWTVKGLEFEDTKADLGGTLTPGAGAVVAGKFVEGEWTITLAITNTNYTLKAGSETGELYVINATTLVLDDSKDDNFERIAAADGEDVDVVLLTLNRTQDLPIGTERKWTAGRWNSLILPFEVTVAELSNAFEYAIFNVVDEANSTETSTKFKLEMGMEGAIPANTPFLIKSNIDIPDNTTITFGGVVYGPKTIVAPDAAKVERAIGTTGNKFVGTYETVKTDQSTPNYYFWYGASDKPAQITPGSSAKWNIVPFACYIDQSANAGAHEMTFIYEELGGETTAIRSIAADEIDKAKVYGEGWYNLNGVKMQGVPTEKGIYIHNGKKVVLK